MATKVTQEEIIKMNEIYAICHNYTQTANAVGRSPSTVKKYIIKNYSSKENIQTNIELPSIEDTINSIKAIKNLTMLTDEEKNEIVELWKELKI